MHHQTKMGKFLTYLLGLFFFIISFPAFSAWDVNMPKGVTPISRDVYELHMTVFWICVGIAVIVFGVLIFSLFFYRKAKGAKAASFHGHTGLEIFWAIIPFLILVVMAIPATKVLMSMEDSADADVTIKIIGHQWKWQYEYLDQGISFFSNLSTPYDQLQSKAKKNKWYLLQVDKPLVIPVHKKIRFLVTSNDVIHSWWVPDLAVKRDAIPGFIHEAWARVDTPGIYRGQCAELCGVNHGFMPIVVKALPEKEFQAWVAKQQAQEKAAREQAAANKVWTKAELMTFGKETYDKYCVACHKADGSGQPPVFPALKNSSVAVGRPISRHVDLVLNGVPGSAMQAFAAQLNDAEIAAVVTYERNAWGNNTGDVIQPKMVEEQRAKPSNKN